MGETRYVDGKLSEVTIQCIDKAEAPIIFFEAQIVSVDDVVDKLRSGDKVLAVWSHPDGAIDLPVEIVTQPNGEESIEVVQRGQPEGYRLVNLPRLNTED